MRKTIYVAVVCTVSNAYAMQNLNLQLTDLTDQLKNLQTTVQNLGTTEPKPLEQFLITYKGSLQRYLKDVIRNFDKTITPNSAQDSLNELSTIISYAPEKERIFLSSSVNRIWKALEKNDITQVQQIANELITTLGLATIDVPRLREKSLENKKISNLIIKITKEFDTKPKKNPASDDFDTLKSVIQSSKFLTQESSKHVVGILNAWWQLLIQDDRESAQVVLDALAVGLDMPPIKVYTSKK